MKMVFPYFEQCELERISEILGDTNSGFTNSEIDRLLKISSIPDDKSNTTKRWRIFNSLVGKCKKDNNCNCVYQFIKECMHPARWLNAKESYENMRIQLNEVLSLKGLQLTERNEYESIKKATSISEAKERVQSLHSKLDRINAHFCVVKCCKEEFLLEDYFHAVHEAAKSLTDRIAEETGLKSDGTALIDQAFSTKCPAIVLNTLSTVSEQNEHRGLKEMLTGINYAIRNVTAHEMRYKWKYNEDDAINVLSIISALHKILDQCHFIMRG